MVEHYVYLLGALETFNILIDKTTVIWSRDLQVMFSKKDELLSEGSPRLNYIFDDKYYNNMYK